jgi:predicted outer membrane repeat protein
MVESSQRSTNSVRTSVRTLSIVFLISSVFSFVFVSTAEAQSDVVTTCAASGTGSLSQVIASAAPGDTVTFSTECLPQSPITLSTTLTIGVNLDIQGPGAGLMAISGNNSVAVFTISSAVTVQISGVTIEDGAATRGGGIDDEHGTLALSKSAVMDSSATGDGGGIYAGGTATISSSALENNTSIGGGGVATTSSLQLVDSTISGNTAGSGDGGGVLSTAATTITTSTISGNTAGSGGGVYNAGGSSSITSSTVDDNTGGLDDAAGTLSLASTIVANSGTGPDCTGSITDAGYNLDDDGSCGLSGSNHSISDVNPELGPLMNNGGVTETQVPASASRSLEQIPSGTNANGTSLCPGTDQTGVARPQGPECDIGSVELSTATAINSPPGVTEPPDDYFSFLVTTTGTSVPSLSETGSLPSTVTFYDNGDGTATLSGTPATSGAFPVTLTATYGSGPGETILTQSFTLDVSSDMNVIPEDTQSSCTGDVDTVAWPALGTPNLTGYEVELFKQGTFEEPPQVSYVSIPADQTTLQFSVPYGFTSIYLIPLVFGASTGPIEEAVSVTGGGQPFSMNWSEQAAAVGAHSATVSFQWSGETSSFQRTGGEPDTFTITASPGGETVNPQLGSDGLTVTGTLKGLKGGTQYTFLETTSNACGTSGQSQQSPTYQPGAAPTLSGTPKTNLTKGKAYSYTFKRGGTPLPTVSVQSGKLPSGLNLSPKGVLSGTPSDAGTFAVTLVASNGFGIGYPGLTTPATLSLTFKVKK